MQHLLEDGFRRLAGERQAACQHLIAQHSECPDVCRGCLRLSIYLLRGHAGRRAGQDARIGHSRFTAGRGDPKIQQLKGAVRQKHDIGGLEVPMDDPAAVSGLERSGNLGQNRTNLAGREFSPAHALSKCLPVQVFHGDEMAALRDSDFRDRDNIWMRKPGDSACAALKASRQIAGFVGRERMGQVQELERQIPSCLHVPGLVDNGHSAPADLAPQVIMSNSLNSTDCGFRDHFLRTGVPRQGFRTLFCVRHFRHLSVL